MTPESSPAADEFQERAESWMKEITAQVARLAGRTEEEDRRKAALDKRLADLEDRMQSLLTLTEMVSAANNPFADAAPSRQPAAAGPVPTAPTTPPAAEAPPMPTPARTEADTEAAPAPQAEDPPSRQEPPAVPDEPAPQAAPPAPAPQAHPNDAMAETEIWPTRPRTATTAAMPGPSAEAPTYPVPARREPATDGRPTATRERILCLEWARLLAPQVAHVDLTGFLGFYVESGWVGSDTTATVRNLACHLAGDHKDVAPIPLDDLHARTMLLLCRIHEGDGAAEVARCLLDDVEERLRQPLLAEA